MGAVDWERRVFDSLVPIPNGTSYNAYLVQGSAGTTLIDTVEPSKGPELLAQLDEVERVDYVISQHAEQDHSGLLPVVLERYPEAPLYTTPLGRKMVVDHLGIAADRIRTVKDGDRLDLGDRSLEFVHTPWVHWPETMCTYLPEERVLFSCDFFGSHLATSRLFAGDDAAVIEAAKLYFGEIMQPFRNHIRKNLEKLRGLEIEFIAPSHGPIHDHPETILRAYEEWSTETPRNKVVLPHVTMHGSTGLLVHRLISALVDRGVEVEPIDLVSLDEGKLAMTLIDAATVVFGTPTVNGGPHPRVATVAGLVNYLKPKTRFLSVIGSFGWGTTVDKNLPAMLPDLKAEMLDPVLCRGLPAEEDLAAVDALAATIAERHREL
jgi:flavorubredoxin